MASLVEEVVVAHICSNGFCDLFLDPGRMEVQQEQVLPAAYSRNNSLFS